MRTNGLTDVIVVGGGLIGCASAHSLAKRGLGVTVFERWDLASGASGACDGHICCQSKAPGAHLDLARRSLSLYETLADELDEQTGFTRGGSWMVAETAEELEALSSASAERQAAGLAVSLHTGAEVRAAEPVLAEGLAGGSFCPGDGQTDPWRTTLAFYRAARRIGARFELGTAVEGVTVKRGRATGVRMRGGRVAAGAVLLAAGAWTASLCDDPGVPLDVRPRRGEVLVTEAMPRLISSIILHAPYVASKLRSGRDRDATLVLEQIDEGNLLIGSTRSYAGFDPRNTPEGIAAVAREAARLAPQVGDLHIVRCFSGLRPCSGDGLPLVGPVPGIESLFVATGHEGDGVALAPITGEIVGRALAEAPHCWPPELLPDRMAAPSDIAPTL